jgi:hypothetical protein
VLSPPFPFPFPCAASPPANVVTPPRHVMLFSMEQRRARCHCFIYWQHFILLSPLSQAKTETLNLHHRHCPPSPDRPTPTLHCYKKVITTLATIPISHPCLHFASSLVRASHHWSSIRRRRSLSPSSHAHRLSAQRYSW